MNAFSMLKRSSSWLSRGFMQQSEPRNLVKVKTQQGWLGGDKLDTIQGDGQYYSFKGIPYAEPPVGKLRFKIMQVVNDDPDLPNFAQSTMRLILKHLNFKYMTEKRQSGLIDTSLKLACQK